MASRHRETIRVHLVTEAAAPSTSISYGELVDHWLKHATLTRETSTGYQSCLNTWVIPEIGAIPLDRITKADLARTRYKAIEAGRSKQTVNNITTVLKSSYRHAAEAGWIDASPKRTIAHDLPSAGKADQGQPPNVEDLKTVLSHLAVEDRELLLWLLLAAGVPARAGEVTGLQWRDLDEKAGTLRIERAIDRWRDIADTKTKKHRTVTVPTFLWPMIEEQRQRQKVAIKSDVKTTEIELQPEWFVFGSVDGGPSIPTRPTHWTHKLARCKKRLDIEGARWVHGMRHLGVAVMQSSGVPDAAGMSRSGHTQISTYKEEYGHAMTGDDKAAAGVLSNYLSGLMSQEQPAQA